MKQFVQSNLQFIALCLLWLVVGMFGGPVILGVLPVTLLLLKQKGLYQELFLGFLFMLVLSDSRQPGLQFAANAKNIYIAMLAVFLFMDSKSFNPFVTFYKRFLPFLLVALICIIFSETALVALQKTLSYFLLIIIIPNYIAKVYQQKGEQFFYNLVVFELSLLLIGFVLKGIKPDVVTLAGRYTGILGNPNGMGLFSTIFFLVFMVVKEYFPSIFNRRVQLLIYFAAFLSVFLSGSRNALVAISLFLFFRYAYRLSPFFGFILFLFITIVYQVIVENIESIIMSLGLGEYFRLQTLENGSGRFVAWKFAWDNIQDNFFIGKGFGYTEYLYHKNYAALSRLGHQGNAHNSFLTLWLDTGLVGLLLYLRGIILSVWEAAKKSRLALPFIYTIVFTANFESWMAGSLNPVTIQMWIVFTILIYIPSAQQVDTKEENAEEEKQLLPGSPVTP